MFSLRRKAGAAAGALLLTGSLIGWSAASSGAGSTSAATPAPEAPKAAAERVIGGGGDSYAPLVDQIAPAVVTVRSERRVRRVSQDLPDNPLFREFFGDRFGVDPRRQVPERRQGGLGSGVVVRPDGYILTNNHVVEDAEQVTVELSDGRSLEAKVVGKDAPSDLAVLKIDGVTNLKTLPLGDSDNVRVGDVVLALGNPLGVGQTVTMGIVSAKGRQTRGAGDGSFEDFIQTDAPINQGNSGGPLVNTRGELVGINSQIMTPTGGNIGIGFAIPANMARNVMTQLIDKGVVRRGMIGVTIQPVTSDIARSLGLAQVRGALVNAVTPGGPADRSGVQRGDVITAINGQTVKDGNELRNDVSQMQPGSDAELTIIRGGNEQKVRVKLAELEARNARGNDEDSPAGADSGYGLAVEPLTADLARRLGVETRRGLVVTVVQSGRAADAGIRQGDVIAEVDGKAVDTPDALRAALKQGDKPALLLVHRGSQSMFLTLERN
jgi:Do/DeqQ family serine protease